MSSFLARTVLCRGKKVRQVFRFYSVLAQSDRLKTRIYKYFVLDTATAKQSLNHFSTVCLIISKCKNDKFPNSACT